MCNIGRLLTFAAGVDCGPEASLLNVGFRPTADIPSLRRRTVIYCYTSPRLTLAPTALPTGRSRCGPNNRAPCCDAHRWRGRVQTLASGIEVLGADPLALAERLDAHRTMLGALDHPQTLLLARSFDSSVPPFRWGCGSPSSPSIHRLSLIGEQRLSG